MTLSTKRAVVLICMDICIVAELTYAFSRCFFTKADFSETFLVSYVPLFVPTMIVAFYFLRRIKKQEQAAQHAAELGQAALES